MNHLSSLIEHYLEYCKYQKCLDKKTLKSYRIDLRQFSEHVPMTEVSAVTSSIIESYIASLHAQYQPKTVKRKIASLKAFFHFLEYLLFYTSQHTHNTFSEKKPERYFAAQHSAYPVYFF